MKFYIFDNNVIGEILHSQDRFDELYKNLKSCNLEWDEATQFLISPFSFLELIGIVQPEIQLTDKETTELKEFRREEIFNFYKNKLRELLLLEKIKNMYNEKLSNIKSEVLKVFFQTNYEAWIGCDRYEIILQDLALDRVYATGIQPIQGVWDLFDSKLMGRNRPQVRILPGLLDYFHKKAMEQPGGSILAKEIIKIKRELKLEDRRQMLDLEIVHFSVLGYNSSNASHPTVAFTKENPEVFKYRICKYKELCEDSENRFLGLLIRNGNQCDKFIDAGKVIFLNQDYSIREIYNV